MKNILLLVHDDAGQEARFQAALDATRAVEGHLTCLDVAIMPALVGVDYAGDAGIGLLLADERQREAKNRDELQRRLRAEDVPWTWLDATGTLSSCIADASGLADLIVVNRHLDDFPLPDMRSLCGDLIVRSNAPILAVPAGLKRLDLASALIAWDGSTEAAAALRAAVPLLRGADRVVVLAVDDASIKTPAEDAAAYLSRHDIHAEIRLVPKGDAGTADTLLDMVSAGAFGYVVMGGFGHARFIESIFGGVTRAMLTRSPVPVLMAH